MNSRIIDELQYRIKVNSTYVSGHESNDVRANSRHMVYLVNKLKKGSDIPVQSSDLLCRDCFYWDKGTCRRYPPQNKWMRQPGMDPKDWCGEHKPKGGE